MPGPSLVLPPVLYTATQWSIVAGLVVLALGIKALVAWWLYRDATARGRNPWGWVIGAIISAIITMIVWLIVRPARPKGRRPEDVHGQSTPTSAATSAADPYRTGFGEMSPDPRTESLEPVDDGKGVPSAVASEAVASPGSLTVTCPRCRNRITVVRNPTGPTPLRCDNCGATGRL